MFKSQKLLLITLLTAFSYGPMSAASQKLSSDPTDIGGSLAVGGAGLVLGTVLRHITDTMTENKDIISNFKKLDLKGLAFNLPAGVASLALGVALQKATRGADYRKQLKEIFSGVVGGYLLPVGVNGGQDADSQINWLKGGLALAAGNYLISWLPASGNGGSTVS